MRGYLPEETVAEFVHAFYSALLRGGPSAEGSAADAEGGGEGDGEGSGGGGSGGGGGGGATPQAAFAAAVAALGPRFRVGSVDGFTLLTSKDADGPISNGGGEGGGGTDGIDGAEGAEGAAVVAIKTPPAGQLRDFSPKLCPSNLPFSSMMDDSPNPFDEARQSNQDDAETHTAPSEEARGGGHAVSRVFTSGGAAWSVLPDSPDEPAEMLAHGSAFVGEARRGTAARPSHSHSSRRGAAPRPSHSQPSPLAPPASSTGRHLEMHALIKSCLHNQLTAVYGGKGAGKSALVLEAARYLRQRNRFPHGIFCCSLEGLRSMKAVRTRLGTTLQIPARSAQELCDLMARYQSCLLILDRCEEAIRKKMPQFMWFLTQLLMQSSVKVNPHASQRSPVLSRLIWLHLPRHLGSSSLLLPSPPFPGAHLQPDAHRRLSRTRRPRDPLRLDHAAADAPARLGAAAAREL